jgi:inner membrane protease subunit 2
MPKPQQPRGTPTPNARFRVQRPANAKPTIPEQPPTPAGPTLLKAKRRPFHSPLLAGLRQRFSTLPSPVRRACGALRWLAPVLPVALFFPEHVMQVMWVRGPSMTPYLNEDYAQTQTKSDMVLVSMWPWGSIMPFKKERKLERGMVVTFR